MKLIFHNEDFNKKMLDKLFRAINEPDEIINIYLSSEGGQVQAMEVFVDIINSDPKRFTIIGYGDLCSCGFDAYLKSNCKKKLLPGTIGMYHQTSNDITMNDLMKPVYAIDKANIDKKKYFKSQMDDFILKCEMTEKEKKKIKKGQDVYFQYDRFLEIEKAYTKNAHIINSI